MRGCYWIAAERTGRMARAVAPDGSWEAIDERAAEPELLELADGRLVLLDSSGAIRTTCDEGATWHQLGTTQAFWPGAVGSTQLVQTTGGILVSAGREGLQWSCDLGQTWVSDIQPPFPMTYDVAAAPDGSVWAAGWDGVYQLSW